MDLENMTTSFLDLKKNATQIGELGGEITEMWVRYMHETLMDVLSKLANNSEEAAKKAFLKALETAKNNSKKTIDQMCELSAKQIGEAYHIGFSEGANMANSLNSKTLRQLIADGAINDADGRIENYLKVADRVHAEALKDVMQGKTLNVYVGGKDE